MRELTSTGIELVHKLRAIWNDKEFVIGILSHVETDEERRQVINFIDDSDNIRSEEVVLFALNIDLGRSGNGKE
jgi:hypothetical protein